MTKKEEKRIEEIEEIAIGRGYLGNLEKEYDCLLDKRDGKGSNWFLLGKFYFPKKI